MMHHCRNPETFIMLSNNMLVSCHSRSCNMEASMRAIILFSIATVSLGWGRWRFREEVIVACFNQWLYRRRLILKMASSFDPSSCVVVQPSSLCLLDLGRIRMGQGYCLELEQLAPYHSRSRWILPGTDTGMLREEQSVTNPRRPPS